MSKIKWCFVRSDRVAFLGFNEKSNRVILNANSWFFTSVIFTLELDENDTKSLDDFLAKVNYYLHNLDNVIKKVKFVAVRKSDFLRFKKYSHFYVNNPIEETITVDLNKLFDEQNSE